MKSVWGVGRTQPSVRFFLSLSVSLLRCWKERKLTRKGKQEWIDATPLLGEEEGEEVQMTSTVYGPIEANATSSLLYDEVCLPRSFFGLDDR